jgi:hypothetical protein
MHQSVTMMMLASSQDEFKGQRKFQLHLTRDAADAAEHACENVCLHVAMAIRNHSHCRDGCHSCSEFLLCKMLAAPT